MPHILNPDSLSRARTYARTLRNSDQRKRLPVLFTGDAFALPDHIAHPEWTSSFDLDAEQTVRTRRRLLGLAAAENCRVVHYHVDGIGHVVRRGSAFAWEPETAPAVLSGIR